MSIPNIPKPWTAEPELLDSKGAVWPGSTWRVVGKSLDGKGSAGPIVATFLSEQDAKFIAHASTQEVDP